MRTVHVHDVMRSRLEQRAGLIERPSAVRRLRDLEAAEWSPEFERLMRNRMMMGALRYRTLAYQKRHGSNYDRIGAIERKIRAYQATGNTELLVDIANYCLLEFELGEHPQKHFAATDDEDHCQLQTA